MNVRKLDIFQSCIHLFIKHLLMTYCSGTSGSTPRKRSRAQDITPCLSKLVIRVVVIRASEPSLNQFSHSAQLFPTYHRIPM